MQGILGETPSAIVVPDDANSVSVFVSEAILTGILCFFCVATVVDESYDNATGALAVGLSVFQGIISG